MVSEMSLTTWRKELEDACALVDESISDLEHITLTPEEMDKEFDNGYGGSEGIPFTAWSSQRVYFPCIYDGREWVNSVPRNPCDERTGHIGGE